MTMTADNDRDFERELAARKHRREKESGAKGGVIGEAGKAADNTVKTARRFHGWFAAAYEATSRAGHKIWDWLDPIAEPIVRVGIWGAPKLARFAANRAYRAAFKKMPDGHREFSPIYLARNIAKYFVISTMVPLMLSAGYAYGTWEVDSDIYIPNAGVFVNQQFVHPNKPGRVTAPRDEIFTVLGKKVENGQIQEVRYDIDMNWFFAFYHDALRPDLAASKMDSQSPYGVKCTVETTGLYNRLPRYLRYAAVRWLDLRPEIIHVENCEELTEMPAVFRAPLPSVQQPAHPIQVPPRQSMTPSYPTLY